MRFVLIDGLAVAYRAYYAIRGLKTRDGRPTNAVYGFIRMVRQLREVWKPTHWGVFFDGGLPAGRTALLETYKAQRPEMPEDLAAQLQVVDAYLDRAGIFWMLREGVEADDLIASVAQRAAGEAETVCVATNDKDLYQIVNDTVRIVAMTGKGEAMGPREVEAKTGVAPGQIVDWLALVGDASDNIPGVPGIGPKTAARLLREHGTLDAVLDGLGAMPAGKVRAALEAHRNHVARNRELVRLDCGLGDLPDWDAMRAAPEDPAALVPFYEAHEFSTLAREAREQEWNGLALPGV
ncbi:MAG: flap endonuclease [Lentisphaerae bacterium]|nr:flap endonuclease [Lentisphaerota bacterium]